MHSPPTCVWLKHDVVSERAVSKVGSRALVREQTGMIGDDWHREGRAARRGWGRRARGVEEQMQQGEVTC